MTVISRKLNILFIPAWYPDTKNPIAGIFIKEHARAVALKNNVLVLVGEKHRGRGGGIKEVSSGREEGIPTVRIRCRAVPAKISFLIYLMTACRVVKKLKEEGRKPDVIHAHVFTAGIPALFLGKIFNIPVVLSEHYTNIGMRILRWPERLKARFVMKRVDAVIAVSQALKKSIRDHYGIRNRFYVIPCAVDDRVFYPGARKSEPDRGKIKLLSVAILTARKGIPNLLEALSRIRQTRQDFILDIVGDGPGRREYEKLAETLNLGEVVRFHGRTPEVASFMRDCDFFVLPSSYENLGVVYLEAMACGKPIIATNAGGPKDFVTDAVGLLVSPGARGQLANAVDHMLVHFRDYSAERIARYARGRFSYKTVGESLDQMYREILDEARPAYPAGNSNHKIRIKARWQVLDVGSGHNPHPRADILLDKYRKDNKNRTGKPIKIDDPKRFVQADACRMPFPDKTFDYIIASHVAEHTDRPEQFCDELMRVGKKGYVETPGKWGEKALCEHVHRWYVTSKNHRLLFEEKQEGPPRYFLAKVFYALFYMNIKREGVFTICFKNRALRTLSDRLAYFCLRNPWRLLGNFTYTCFEWENGFSYKVIYRSGQVVEKSPRGAEGMRFTS